MTLNNQKKSKRLHSKQGMDILMDFNNIHQKNVRDRPFLSVRLQNKRPGGVIDCERAINKGRSVIRRRGCSNNDYDVIA